MASPAVQLQLAGAGSESWASLSADKRYRYSLGRRWDVTLPLVLFVGLNPSDADELVDDPTCRKWRGFAERWGFGGFVAGNLCGFRTPFPVELERRARLGLELECVGDRNDEHLRLLASHPAVDLIVPCWGASVPAELRHRVDDVLTLLRGNARGVPLKCLGLTASGDPRHPARLGYDTPLVAFGGARG